MRSTRGDLATSALALAVVLFGSRGRAAAAMEPAFAGPDNRPNVLTDTRCRGPRCKRRASFPDLCGD